MIDDRTATLNLPKPNAANTLLEDVDRLRTALDGIDTAVAARELSANKGQPNGYAGLDSGGKVPAAQLPSYVDDVLEFASLANFPGVGETGKIYVATDTGLPYRWSGSGYIEISPSPGSTDAVPEGSVNQYFTPERARAAQNPATTGAVGVVQVGQGLDVTGGGQVSVKGSQATGEAVWTAGDQTIGGQKTFSSAPDVGTAAAKTADNKAASTAFVDRLRSMLASGSGSTLDATDRGAVKKITAGVTVPASVFAENDVVTLYNNSAGALTITQGSGLTLRLVGTETTGNRTIAGRGLVTILFISATEAVISGGGLS